MKAKRKKLRRARAVRRLQGKVNALALELRGKGSDRARELSRMVSSYGAQLDNQAVDLENTDMELTECQERIAVLEKVPRWLRWLFRAA